jgi:hypothetical protein
MRKEIKQTAISLPESSIVNNSMHLAYLPEKLSKKEKTSPILRLVKTPTAAIRRCPALVCGIFTGNFAQPGPVLFKKIGKIRPLF